MPTHNTIFTFMNFCFCVGMALSCFLTRRGGNRTPDLVLIRDTLSTTELRAVVTVTNLPVGSKGVEPLPIRLKGGHATITPQPQMLVSNAFQS